MQFYLKNRGNHLKNSIAAYYFIDRKNATAYCCNYTSVIGTIV